MTLTYEFKIEKTMKGFILSCDSNDTVFRGGVKEFYETKEDVMDAINHIVSEWLK